MSSQQATNNAIVVQALSEIAKAAEETASSSGGASSFTEEQTSAMEEMSASAQELSVMANDLLDMVGRFEAGGGRRTALPEGDRPRPEGRALGSAVRGLARRPGVEKQGVRSESAGAGGAPAGTAKTVKPTRRRDGDAGPLR
jgi:hypothetical protein